MEMNKILIVDDEENELEAMEETLSGQGYDIITKSSGKDALSSLKTENFDVILTDLKMPDVDGLEILKTAKETEPEPDVIVITGFGSVDTAVEAMRSGASDYIEKPLDIGALREKVRKTLENQSIRRENTALHRQNEALQRQINEKFGFSNIIGNSKQMRDIFQKLKLVSPTKANVLIIGETGTGKDLIANAIHINSPRKDKPFIPINCAAISSELLASELFGHERGAFTGAVKLRQGAFELANKGTLFLDEVGEMSPDIQAKFLRVVEEQQFRRLGGEKPISVDVRIISATNKDLSEEVEAKRFRQDLYYRLMGVTIDVPPLRNRKEDIPILANAFLHEANKENNKEIANIDREAMEYLINYDWPGNVRELKNYIESMVVMSVSDTITVDDLPANIRGAENSETQSIIKPGMTMEEIEKEAIRQTLEDTDGNRTKTADILKISLRTLHRKIQKYGLS
ncbi:response regulator [Candidatus Poribacteria bacterium]|nr:response regulator [Candidatus Poribacteria bacterium]